MAKPKNQQPVKAKTVNAPKFTDIKLRQCTRTGQVLTEAEYRWNISR